jgi:polysaccharide biosynthesis transport protein
MELKKFFSYLYKNILILIIIPIVTVVITYFLVRNLPTAYISKAQIATGLVNQTDDALLTGQSAPNPQEIELRFSNMIQIIKLNKVLDFVSYKLLIHDLGSKEPFRKLSKKIQGMSHAEKVWVVNTLKKRYLENKPLTLTTDEESKLLDIISSMGYQSDALIGKLVAYRIGQSDFIMVEFESENPMLSAYVANQACAEFIRYYAGNIRDADRKSVNFLANLLKEKQNNLNEKMTLLKNYKIQNGVLNLPEQARILYGRMIETQSNIERTDKDIISKMGAINDINRKFSPSERRYFESVASKVHRDIAAQQEQLKALTEVYISEGYAPVYKESIDSLTSILRMSIDQSVDERATSPLSLRQELLSQRINLETEADIARHSVSSLVRELKSLNSAFTRLVPFEAIIQSYERDIQIASEEYLDILGKYNLTNMQSNFSVKLKQNQYAMPGEAIPNKKMLLIIISGVVGFAFVVLVLFVLFYLDSSITEPKELANVTQFPVLGYIEKLSSPTTDIHTLWNWNKGSGFKDQLRSIRFEISNELDQSILALPSTDLAIHGNTPVLPQTNNRILCVTSFSKGEGKTLLGVGLAYAFALTNKNILLIDGNFSSNTLSKSINTEYDFEDYLTGNISETDFKRRGISVLGNKGTDTSLLEITDQSTLTEKLTNLKASFDYIIIEIPPLKLLDKAKEWFGFTDKLVGVFEANRKVDAQQKVQTDYLHALNQNKFIGWVINKVEISKPEKKGWFKRRKKNESVS